ncbi:site-specific DNA-methyltransferase [Hydrogenovibrio thermophilus]|uniref:site-specific DNA-methyltransferase (adenine-specific) n=1 Tax=Hydrogenovibrio thermophilus TaxID=265883 RepID=A0A451G536_9GAMM|nr:site-specific DNA-methyltransferase [Hydrogenovibrio thermophilus]QAB14608.1 site-specific DNA-methyltransferase [Hydrogenovibrio thermophilus]
MADTQNDLQQLTGQSMNLTEHNIEQLKTLFPNVFSEGKIDFDALKVELGENIDESNERYQFTWSGKEQAKRIATTPTLGTLRPAPEESVNWDNTENLYIEGDNLEVLKLLQKSYFGKVKMIYIDPPYNTGKDFVYKDDFKDNLANYQRLTGQKDEEGNPLTTNADSAGRYHSNWLNMMYPRLKLARNLLKDDGVIFISIDDNEVHNLRKICDEIFGEENFIEEISWKNKYGAGAKTKGFISVHEYILCYSKNQLLNLESPLDEDGKKAYNKQDSKFPQRGGFFTQPLMTTSMDDRPNLQYEIEHQGIAIKPTKQWVWSKERLLKAIEDDEVVFNKKPDGTFSVRAKQYLKDEYGNERKGKPTSLMNGPFTQEGTSDIASLFEMPVFGFPKPKSLLKNFFAFAFNEDYKKEGIYLDFFSGSATSAHAIMELNTEDKGNRKLISVQIPEPTPVNSEARKAGYATIAEIGKERIRRAAKKIKEEHPETQADLGFKVFKLDTSNIKKWQPNVDDLDTDLLNAVDNIVDGRTSQDLLFEVLIKYGLPLTLPIEEVKVADHQAWNVAFGSLIACFDENITLETVQAIADLSTPENPVLRVVFRDTSFKDDITKTNAIQRLKQAGIEDVLSI